MFLIVIASFTDMLHLLHLLIFFYQSLFSSLSAVFDASPQNIDKIFSFNPSGNVLVFGYIFNLFWWNLWTWKTPLLYSAVSHDFTQLDNYPTKIPHCDACSPGPVGYIASI